MGTIGMIELDFSLRADSSSFVTPTETQCMGHVDSFSVLGKRHAPETRPQTPEYLKQLRTIIDNAAEDTQPHADPQPTTTFQPSPPPPAMHSHKAHQEPCYNLKEAWKHAGLFSEFGGIKRWLELQKQHDFSG